MEKKDYNKEILQFLKRYPSGINLTPQEIITLLFIKIYSDGNFEKNYIEKDLIFFAVQKTINLLNQLNTPTVREDVIVENLLKKNLLIFSSTSINSYYISDIGSSIIESIFYREIEDQSDVESNIYTIYMALKALENSDKKELKNFLTHPFYDLILKLDHKIRNIKEKINNSKNSIKVALKTGDETSLRKFIDELTNIKSIIKNITTSLSRYSSYNQIIYMLNMLQKKYEHDIEISDLIFRASMKLFGLKNEIENLLIEIAEFINRHTSLLTMKINVSSLDKIINFQQKLLTFFGKKGLCLSKPERMKPSEFRYKWQQNKRKPIYIEESNNIINDEIDQIEEDEVNIIVNELLEKVNKYQIINYTQEIIDYPLARGNLPKYYNLIISKLSEFITIIDAGKEIEIDGVFYSDIEIMIKKSIGNERKELANDI